MGKVSFFAPERTHSRSVSQNKTALPLLGKGWREWLCHVEPVGQVTQHHLSKLYMSICMSFVVLFVVVTKAVLATTNAESLKW
ncbi:hypothetical protein ACROYT_G014661 [Oculina patagonica]